MECTHFENKTLHRHSTFLLWREKKKLWKTYYSFYVEKKKFKLKLFLRPKSGRERLRKLLCTSEYYVMPSIIQLATIRKKNYIKTVVLQINDAYETLLRRVLISIV